MCELFGISSNRPTSLKTSLGRFRKRGGETSHHRDGWGLAYRANDAFHLHKEPKAAATSKRLSTLADTVRTSLLVAHVRKARHPLVNSYANTHPFIRRCCGREWVFAHNGLVPEIMNEDNTRLEGRCLPVGDTDSEYAFYYLLEQIATRFPPGVLPENRVWLSDLAAISELLASYGQFNFLMSDSDYLLAYGHDRLHSLHCSCGDLRIALMATEPLTQGEPWQPFEAGELRVYHGGELITQLKTRPERLDNGATQAPCGPQPVEAQ